MHTRTISFVVAAVTLSLAGCNRTLDAKKLEISINTELKAKGVELRSLKCPVGERLKQGDKFDCEALDNEGRTLTIHVEQTDARGTISWKLDGMIIDLQKVGDSIEQKVGGSADVKCPGRSSILRVNESFECDATIRGNPHKVSITLTDTTGSVSWKVIQ